MGPIVENNFQIPNGIILENLSDCLLLQCNKEMTHIPDLIDKQFELISKYLKTLDEKRIKQEKYLLDVFNCAVEGDMKDSSLCFMVHEAKAIEACLTKLGELYRYIKNDPSFDTKKKKFLKKCRPLRNRIAHEVSKDKAKGYNPISGQMIQRFAEEAKKFWDNNTHRNETTG